MPTPKSGGKTLYLHVSSRWRESTLFASVQIVAGKSLFCPRLVLQLCKNWRDIIGGDHQYVFILSQQGLFRNFDDTFVDLIKPHLERLCIDPQVGWTLYMTILNSLRCGSAFLTLISSLGAMWLGMKCLNSFNITRLCICYLFFCRRAVKGVLLKSSPLLSEGANTGNLKR